MNKLKQIYPFFADMQVYIEGPLSAPESQQWRGKQNMKMKGILNKYYTLKCAKHGHVCLWDRKTFQVTRIFGKTQKPYY